jgi:hypothetical protein
MDPKAIEKARSRLRVAEKAIRELEKAANHQEFSDSWYSFLTAAKNVYTSLEQGSKMSARSRQWYGAKKRERKNDALLQYLFQARDDDVHGLNPVTVLDPGRLVVGAFKPGMSNSIDAHISTDEMGRPTIHKLKSLDRKPILIEDRAPHTKLGTVTGRGNIKYLPPNSHMGKALESNLPIPVARLAISYLTGLVADASELHKP